ncbi:TniB family NTP-binding protein [Pseudomonas sp. JM0905a]|uniref:TniB family NTP-binding protein n=1 Tax=Pseudomonas sp. JM0905a TaxID=2772484 RepID=UPI00168513A9|nr:TniB family NTP-binding protein [Pseudomonas sp. JM0905a]MBD2837100.1 TniB family NTP-binding protein [Pseudomonas sp. JM0905a]
MIDYQHLLPEFRGLLSLSDAERLAAIRPRWIDYEFADKLHKMLFAKLCGHRDQPDIFILGEPRMGKTTLIKRFIEVHAPEFINIEGVREKPVLLVEVSKPNAREFLIDILDTSVSPYNPDATESKLFFQVMNLFRSCKTKMLIIDEIQSLNQGTAREVTAMATLIKRLSNKAGISIIGVGVDAARQLLPKDDQYLKRFVTVTVPDWKASPAFRQFLKGFESWLPLRQPSNLASVEMAAFILKKTGGNTSRVEELLLGCARKAITTGRERIDLDLLSQPKWTIDSFGTREVAP